MVDSEDNRSPHTIVVALLGGAIGVAFAIAALLAVGNDPAYRSRVFCGWIALLCALVASWSVLLTGRHRRTAMVLTLLGGAVGAVAINLFYLNTYYVMALPCWLLGLLMAEIRSPTRALSCYLAAATGSWPRAGRRYYLRTHERGAGVHSSPFAK